MTDAPKTFQYCGIINSGSSHLQIQVEIFQDGQYPQEVSRILASGADPNVPDELGETPIFEA